MPLSDHRCWPCHLNYSAKKPQGKKSSPSVPNRCIVKVSLRQLVHSKVAHKHCSPSAKAAAEVILANLERCRHDLSQEANHRDAAVSWPPFAFCRLPVFSGVALQAAVLGSPSLSWAAGQLHHLCRGQRGQWSATLVPLHCQSQLGAIVIAITICSSILPLAMYALVLGCRIKQAGTCDKACSQGLR